MGEGCADFFAVKLVILKFGKKKKAKLRKKEKSNWRKK
jgi:hypothetical protein